MAEYNRKDKLYNQAKSEGYRSRAAYKLIELDEKFHLFRKGMRVLDLGSFPGGWLQVSLAKVGPSGVVVGIDLKEIDPVAMRVGNTEVKPTVIIGDITEAPVLDEIEQIFGSRVGLVLSDMSPHLTGISFGDAARSADLVLRAFEVAKRLLEKGGGFVAKIFPGPEAEELNRELKRNFKKLTRVYLDSTRKTSSEFYFVCQDFKLESAHDS